MFEKTADGHIVAEEEHASPAEMGAPNPDGAVKGAQLLPCDVKIHEICIPVSGTGAAVAVQESWTRDTGRRVKLAGIGVRHLGTRAAQLALYIPCRQHPTPAHATRSIRVQHLGAGRLKKWHAIVGVSLCQLRPKRQVVKSCAIQARERAM